MSSRSPAGKLSKLSRRAADCGATRTDIQEAEGLPREMAEDALIALALRAQQDAIQHTLSQHDTTGTSPIPDAFFAAVRRAGTSSHPGKAMISLVANNDPAAADELARLRSGPEVNESSMVGCANYQTRLEGLGERRLEGPETKAMLTPPTENVRVNVRGDDQHQKKPAGPCPPYFIPSAADPDFESCNAHLNESTANYPAWSPRQVSRAVIRRCRPAPPRNRPSSVHPSDRTPPPQFHGPYFQTEIGGLRLPSRGGDYPRDQWNCVVLVGDVRNTWQTVDRQRFGSKIQSDPLESITPVFMPRNQGGARSIPKEQVWLHGSYRYTDPTNGIVRHMDSRPSARESAGARAHGIAVNGTRISVGTHVSQVRSTSTAREFAKTSTRGGQRPYLTARQTKAKSRLPQILTPRGSLSVGPW